MKEKIYRNNDRVVIEGLDSYSPLSVNYILISNRVQVFKIGKEKPIFDEVWSNITDESNTNFNNQADIIAHLQYVFEKEEEHILFENLNELP